MSRLDDLPPDQRAALSLLLRSGKSYAEVSKLLSIPQRAVHDRAHAALAVLAPREARELSAERREQIGDYVLGQRAGVAERLAARTYLERSAEGRAWADALALELAALTGASSAVGDSAPRKAPSAPATAEVSRPPPAAAYDPTQRPRPPLPSSRLGGGLLLAALIAAVIIAVVLLAGGGHSHRQAPTTASGAGSAPGTSSSTTSAQAGRATEDKRITLSSPDPSSKSVGVAEVLSEGSKHAFYLAAEHLPPSKGFFYAIWLYNSPSSHEALSRAPTVGSNGRLQGGALLPNDAGKYHKMLITRETSSQPKSPGPTVLSGDFALR